MKTVLEAILEKDSSHPTGNVWNGRIDGPSSYDDLFEIGFWFKETEDSPVIKKKIVITGYKIVDEW